MTGISDWAGSPMSTLHHTPAYPQPIRVEQYADGTGYEGCQTEFRYGHPEHQQAARAIEVDIEP